MIKKKKKPSAFQYAINQFTRTWPVILNDYKFSFGIMYYFTQRPRALTLWLWMKYPFTFSSNRTFEPWRFLQPNFGIWIFQTGIFDCYSKTKRNYVYTFSIDYMQQDDLNIFNNSVFKYFSIKTEWWKYIQLHRIIVLSRVDQNIK